MSAQTLVDTLWISWWRPLSNPEIVRAYPASLRSCSYVLQVLALMKRRLKDVKALVRLSTYLDLLFSRSTELRKLSSSSWREFLQWILLFSWTIIISIHEYPLIHLVVLDSAPGFGVQILSTMEVFVASWENWDALSISYQEVQEEPCTIVAFAK